MSIARKVMSGGGVFSPEQLFRAGDEGGFWDANDPDTVFSDTAGTIPATHGSLLYYWKDKSPNANHLRYGDTGTADDVPAYYYTDQDGGPSCSRPGTGTVSSRGRALTTIGTTGNSNVGPPWTIACIVALNDTGGGASSAIWAGAYKDANDSITAHMSSKTGKTIGSRMNADTLGYASSNVNGVGTLTDDVAAYQLCVSTEGVSGTNSVFLDTVSQGSSPYAHNWEAGTIAMPLVVGLGDFDMRVHAVFQIDRVLTAFEQGKLDAWMMTRKAV